ncbi:MAG: B12-binding domain-containing radical SAM protein, partial [Candidatus Omnitrophica bacterium]|nr:B12-binding domain-containing radical SAM protein [Candidatus Omnitrophota bacterium]
MDGVLKPGRYINGEWNAARKEWDYALLKVALCFPDIYEIGMSHLGMKIIYGILNNEKDVLCERVFTPWNDMEQKLRAMGEPLVSLENRKPLREFDIIGFSLQYEMGYVDVLNMLDLGNVPLRSEDRGDSDPIVIAGGPCAFNPEPMVDFIDAFVIGEAEEAILEMANVVKGLGCRVKNSRQNILQELSKIEGIYVPAFTLSAYGETSPATSGGHPSPFTLHPKPFTINKRIIKDLNNAYFPTSPVVPYIQIVHDRITIEIMRGCPHQCRFCQACRIF